MTTQVQERQADIRTSESESHVFHADLVKVSNKQTGERPLHLAEGGIEGGGYISGIGIEEGNMLGAREAEELTAIFRDAIDSTQELGTAEELAVMLDKMQKITDDEFSLQGGVGRLDRAAVYVVRDGSLVWSADTSESSLGLVLARADGTVQHLGSEDGSHIGVITDIHAEDKVYMLPNRLIRDMKQTKAFALNGLEMVADEDDVQANIVSVAFDEAYQSVPVAKAASTPEKPVRERRAPMSAAERRTRKKGFATTEPSSSKPASGATPPNTTNSSNTTAGNTEPPSPLNNTYPAGLYDSPVGPAMEDGSMVRHVSAKPADAYDVTYGDTHVGPKESPVRELVKSDGYKDARDIYDAADNALAVKVGRRLKLGMFASKKTREAYSAEVEAQRIAYERMSEGFDAIQIEKWKLRNPNISEKDLAAKLANYHEAKLRLQGLRSQHEIVTTHGKFGKLSEWSDKATEWYSRQSKVTKVGIAVGSIAVGAVGGLLVATAGTVIGGTAGVVGGGMLAAAKVKKTHMQSRAGLYRNTIAVDKTRIENADGTYKSALTLKEESEAALRDSLGERAEKADKINKKTKWMTIASVALLGAGVASHIEVVHNVYKAAEEHIGGWFDSLQHPTGTPRHVETGITPSQGGGSGHNPIDKLGSGDVYTPPQVSVPTAPGHDIFAPKDLGGATEFKGAGLDHFNQWVSGHTVQPGESVWKLSQDYLRANGVQNPSVFQIDAVKDSVLAEFSAKGLVDSNGWLTAGELLNIK